MGTRGTVGTAALVLLLASIVSPPGVLDACAQQHRDQALPGCGICYPGGYDVNTVGRVQGEVLDLQLRDEGPVRLVVVGGGERWIVLACPTWFWKKTGLRLGPGDAVTACGSKTLGADGNLYLVARELLPAGAGTAIFLRDRRGLPLWREGYRGGEMTDSGSGDGHGSGRGRGRGGACRP